MGHYDVVKFLLTIDKPKIDINYVNYRQRTALHKAAFNGNSNVVILLLENGADPRLNDISLQNAYDIAVNKKTKHILKNWEIEKTIEFW